MTRRPFSLGSLLPLVLILILSVMWIRMNDTQTNLVNYSRAVQLFRQEQVSSFTVQDERLTMHLRTPENGNDVVYCNLHSFDVFYDEMNELVEKQFAAGVITEYDYTANHSTDWVSILLPTILSAVVIIGVILYMNARQGVGFDMDRMNQFGTAHVHSLSEKDSALTFDDVAGAKEEKEELEEIVEFLRAPDDFLALGARIPKGVLLVGPPGTGKTLLAKACAGEAGVEFLSISGSDFVELYVGVGARRVRDLFDQAKRVAPCIVFIDEIDAVGRQRGAGFGGGHDEREQTLNQLLVEMDGFSANEGVVVLAATNRVDVLDPALLRPGRFDRQVYVGLPDIKGREEILKIHSKGKPLGEDVDLSKIARGTAGFTGADLENLMNEAALLTARRKKTVIDMETLHEAEIKVIAGPEKRSRVVPEHERRLAAWHEAGHAVVSHFLPELDPVSTISIIPRGQAGGMTIFLPEEDRSFLSKKYMESQLISLLGGRAAEKLCIGDISTGASNDIERATRLARKMVASFGMSEEIGTVAFDSGHDEVFLGRSMAQGRSYSEETAAKIDAEVRRVLASALERCEAMLSEHRDALDAVAEYLLAHDTMDREAFLKVFEKPEEA